MAEIFKLEKPVYDWLLVIGPGDSAEQKLTKCQVLREVEPRIYEVNLRFEDRKKTPEGVL